jgi:ADP-ribosylglycohydrolase
MPEATRRERIVGSLLGGAIGDALGAPVEFLSWGEIEKRFGPDGIRGFAPAYGGVGRITDDTQMTLFTAEGLIRAEHHVVERGLVETDVVLHRAYLRWLSTQDDDAADVPWDAEIGVDTSGWLLEQTFLHSQRAPGATCLGALRSGWMGTPDRPLNDSKGCGGVMRVAPVGLVAREPFDLGCQAAAITHGHATGWLAAGAFAQILSDVASGDSFRGVVESTTDRCHSAEGGVEVAAALRMALELADEGWSPTPEQVALLGEGWVAEEALSIAVYCVLSDSDPAAALVAAANHSGDSDSTGSITGNILGAIHGVNWLDPGLLGQLEGRAAIEQIANDLDDAFGGGGDLDWDRYPPW